ncbi:MAG: hypothetical protein HDQ96_02335 [Lachnospiraceae bacterium]|nr:hypothetical protein [Lachnospiraceae bacterium]
MSPLPTHGRGLLCLENRKEYVRNWDSTYADSAQLHLRMAFVDSRKCKLHKGVLEEYVRN